MCLAVKHRTGRKQAREHHRFDEGTVALNADVAQELIEFHRAPCLHKGGKLPAIQSLFGTNGFGFHKGAPRKGLRNEFTHVNLLTINDSHHIRGKARLDLGIVVSRPHGEDGAHLDSEFHSVAGVARASQAGSQPGVGVRAESR